MRHGQERNRESSAISGPVHEKCVGLEDYGVCGDELPGICSCLLEGKAGAQIFRVVSDEVRKERARIDENASPDLLVSVRVNIGQVLVFVARHIRE